MMKFEIGDWVQGRSADGEFITGYLETLDPQQNIARVRVVQSDNRDTAGKLIAVRHSWLRQLPEYTERNAVQLKSLIDIALAAGDEAWFNELTASLNERRSLNEESSVEPSVPTSIINRLGIYGKM